MTGSEFLKPTKGKFVTLVIIFLIYVSFFIIIYYRQEVQRSNFNATESTLLAPLNIVVLFVEFPSTLLSLPFFFVKIALTFPYMLLFDSIFLLIDFLWVYLVICTAAWLYATIRKRTEPS